MVNSYIETREVFFVLLLERATLDIMILIADFE